MEISPGLGDWASGSPFPWQPRAPGRRRRLPRRARGRRLRRELSLLEAELTAQTPTLAALYVTFSQLHGDERPRASSARAAPPPGAEPLPLPLWRRPRFGALATLALLAAMVALCATLSVQLRPSSPSCFAAASAPAAASSAAAAQVRAMDCGEYPAK